ANRAEKPWRDTMSRARVVDALDQHVRELELRALGHGRTFRRAERGQRVEWRAREFARVRRDRPGLVVRSGDVHQRRVDEIVAERVCEVGDVPREHHARLATRERALDGRARTLTWREGHDGREELVRHGSATARATSRRDCTMASARRSTERAFSYSMSRM